MNYLAIMLAVCVIAAGQIIFKHAARTLVGLSGDTFSIIELIRLNLAPLSWIALALSAYGLSTIAWIYALRYTPLSVAYMFNALAFIIIPIASSAIFDESLSRSFFLGASLIAAGIVITTI